MASAIPRLALVISALVTGQHAQATCTLGALAVLPTVSQNGHLLVDVDVNGQQARLIFDTGAFALLFDRPAAERLGIRLARIEGDMHGVGGYRHIYTGSASRLRVGKMQADGIMVGAQDGLLSANSAGYDGLFGMNMMAHADIDIDVPGQHVIIYQPSGNCREPAVALADPLYDAPLVSIVNDLVAEVDLSIGGRGLRAIVDLGASRTVIFRHAARRLGVDLAGFSGSSSYLSHGIGPFPVHTFTHVFPTVKIGGLEFHNMPIEVIDQEAPGEHNVHTGSRLVDVSDGEAGGEDMLLGLDFMRKVHVWISHSSHRLIMQYPPLASKLPQ